MDSEKARASFSTYKAGIIEKLNSWDNMLRSKEDMIKKLEEEEMSCKGQKEDLEKKIQEIQESLSELELQKLAKLEAEGVSQKLLDLINQIKGLLSQQGINTIPLLPECPVCLEVCNPSQGRLVCCCPEGHPVCGQCADKVTECPTCRRAKASFGGAFTRVRWFEGKASFDEDDLTIFERVGELALIRRPLKERKEQVENEFQKSKDPLEKELSVVKENLQAKEKDISRIKEDLQMAEKDLTNLAETLDSRISQIEGVTNYLDIERKSSEMLPFKFLGCSCALSCPHPLVVGTDGRICSKPCECIKTAPCMCVTHQITLDLDIKRGSSGSVNIALAGRTNPRAVNRLCRVARENFYAGTIVDRVSQSRNFINMGYKNVHREEQCFTSFTPEEWVLDSTDKHFIKNNAKYVVGYWEDENRSTDQDLRIYMGSPASEDFRTVGAVVEGIDLIEEIYNRAPYQYIALEQFFLIKKSSGCIVTRRTQL